MSVISSPVRISIISGFYDEVFHKDTVNQNSDTSKSNIHMLFCISTNKNPPKIIGETCQQ